MHTRPDSTRLQTRVGISTPDGRVPLVRSLGTCDTSRAAVVSEKAQALADAVPSGDWLKTKRLVEDIFIASGFPPPSIIRDSLPVLRLILPFTEEYIARKRKESLSKSHVDLLSRCLLHFARNHEGMELVDFKGHHLQTWVDNLVASCLAPGSVRNQLSAFNSLFSFARDMGHIAINPCAAVVVPESSAVVHRIPLSDEDFGLLIASLRRAENWDWLTTAMNMRYAGLRLTDAARMVGEGVTFHGEACLICLTPGKTDNPEVLPVFEPLAGYLKALKAAGGPLAPSLASLSPSCLSKQMSALFDSAGIDGQIVTLANGRRHRRVSGHSLKHSFVTWLARLGIPESLRMKMSAHVTEEAHRGYNHEDGLDLHRQVSPYFTSKS